MMLWKTIKKLLWVSFEEFLLVVVLGLIGMLVAFILKVLWNASIPETFGGPALTWLQVWCMYMIMIVLLRLVPWRA